MTSQDDNANLSANSQDDLNNDSLNNETFDDKTFDIASFDISAATDTAKLLQPTQPPLAQATYKVPQILWLMRYCRSTLRAKVSIYGCILKSWA